MKSLCLFKPLPIVQVSNASAARMITPDPKEAAPIPGTAYYTFDFDFGALVTFDSMFVGYHDALTGSPIVALQEVGSINGGAVSYIVGDTSMKPLGLGPPYHTFVSFPARTCRYVRLTVNRGGGNLSSIGNVAFGLAWSAKWGQEMGAGRFIEDASTVERLFGGGFGIDEGAITGGYQWTFGDLQNDEIRTLYQTIKGLGTSRTLLVVEDPEQTDGLNERIHWGVLSKIEAYERVDPNNTKWGLSIRDWG